MGFTPHTRALKMDKPILGSVIPAPAGKKMRPKLPILKTNQDYIILEAKIENFRNWLRHRKKYQEIEEARTGLLKEVIDKLDEILA